MPPSKSQVLRNEGKDPQDQADEARDAEMDVDAEAVEVTADQAAADQHQPE